MAIGLFCLTITQSICQHQFFFRSMHTGAMARAALISATYKRAVNLSVASRSKHPTGRLNAYLSSDISRVDYCAAWFHAIWTAPIQLLVCLILLLVQIGPSALVGFAVFILLAPLQTYFMRTTFKTRQKSMVSPNAVGSHCRFGQMEDQSFFKSFFPLCRSSRSSRMKYLS